MPERCWAGRFFGGTFGMAGSNKRTARLAGLQIIPDSVTADTLTELDLRDSDWSNDQIDITKKRDVVHIKKNVDDGEGNFISINPPIKFTDGIEVLTNTNCRVALYVE